MLKLLRRLFRRPGPITITLADGQVLKFFAKDGFKTFRIAPITMLTSTGDCITRIEFIRIINTKGKETILKHETSSSRFNVPGVGMVAQCILSESMTRVDSLPEWVKE